MHGKGVREEMGGLGEEPYLTEERKKTFLCPLARQPPICYTVSRQAHGGRTNKDKDKARTTKMKKLETGDVVKVISTGCASCGNVGIVKKITDNKKRPYTVMFLDAESEYSEDELEKVCDGKTSNGKKSRKTILVNTSKQMIEAAMKAAKAKVMRSRPLRGSLKDWFNHKGKCPFNDTPLFSRWGDKMLEMMRGEIGNDRLVTADNLAAALRVQSMGDPIALKCARQLEKKNVQTDINCYVEEGKVYASVWIKHMVVDYVNELADKVRSTFRNKGYLASICVDDEDSSEVTVCAVMDVEKFFKSQTKGGR